MPYIKEVDREFLGCDTVPRTSGELNYCITELLLSYLGRSAGDYSAMNEIMGALECAKQEFYRRVMVPYENAKMEQNGDVY
jgi:hypothetical protein